MLDTLDLVIVGHKKNEYFIIACYDDDRDEYCTIGVLKENELPDIDLYNIDDARVVSMYDIDRWIYPEIVIEVSCDSIESSHSQRSPYFLVNPLFIKVRDDKNAEHATTLDEVAYLYNNQ
jgi:ATP-dependent DNA ligase